MVFYSPTPSDSHYSPLVSLHPSPTEFIRLSTPVDVTDIDTEKKTVFYSSMIDTCCKIYEPWNDLSFKTHGHFFRMQQIQGGITNQLFRVFYNDTESVLFRLYGRKTEIIINRSFENQIVPVMTKLGFGPKMYGTAPNGRVEEWLSGHSIDHKMMASTDMLPKIGGALASMHILPMPFDKTPKLFVTLSKWLDVVDSIEFEDEDTRDRHSALDFASIRAEVELLQQRLTEAAPSPVVFAHNDLLGGNIIYESSANRITLIDFEYSGYNFRAFDIANHFCECAGGFDCEWDLLPDKSQQFDFFRGYIATYSGKPESKVSNAELEALYAEVNPWILTSHLFWGVWSMVQAKHSPILFDFVEYSERRIQAYWDMKDKYLGMMTASSTFDKACDSFNSVQLQTESSVDADVTV
jgi:ethanolamine kinase